MATAPFVPATASVDSSAAVGFAFGFALEKAKVYVPSVIIDQMRFKSLIMLEMYLTATVGGTLVMHALRSGKVVDIPLRPPISLGFHKLGGYGRNILGGALLGVGMALAGACPGTVLVQAATGVRYSFLVLAGAVTGSLAWPYINELFSRSLPDYGKKKPTVSLPKTLKIDNTTFVIIFASVLTAFIAFGAKAISWAAQLQRAYTLPIGDAYVSLNTNVTSTVTLKADIADVRAFAWHPVVGGMVIAAAQFMSLVLLANPLGASTQYAIVASSILKRVDPKWRTRASACNAVPTVTADSDWSDAITRLLNTAGVVAGAFVSAKLGGALVNSAAFAATPQSWVMDEGTKAFVGGALLLLGSRIGDGCTSGHGISGVAALSTASAVSVASMFAGAMIVANLIY